MQLVCTSQDVSRLFGCLGIDTLLTSIGAELLGGLCFFRLCSWRLGRTGVSTTTICLFRCGLLLLLDRLLDFILSRTCSFSFVHDGEQLLFWYSHIVGHLAQDLTLLLDNLVSLQIVNEFVVLARHAEGLLEIIDIVFFLSNDLFKTNTNHFMRLELKDDELFVLFKLTGKLLVELNVLFRYLLYLPFSF